MPKHVHDFEVLWDEEAGRLFAYCSSGGIAEYDCNLELEDVEIERCLNAVHRLRSIDAGDAAVAIEEKKMLTVVVENLRAYATVLEESK
jgi:hypothetical protein